MLAIPPTTNQWPQNQIDDVKIMEKQGQELQQQQQQQQALKCPRCDSSNTKFCYYNNYSLSQPRHFCKACKRYWTRGGTLRNVPVGGGYRRNNSNKRSNNTTLIKRPSTIDTTNSSSTPSSTPNTTSSNSTLNHNISPMFYGLSSSNNSCDVNLPFSRFNISRISTSSGYDFQPQMNTIGLGFSSGFTSSEANDHNGYTNGFTSNNNINTLVSRCDSIFSSSSAPSNASVMPSLLSSALLQHKFMNDGSNTFQGLEFNNLGNGSEKGMKKDEGEMEHVGGLYDPPASSLYWNTASSSAIGVWNDQGSNIGSSVTSLI